MVYRSDKGAPLTIEEMDGNFREIRAGINILDFMIGQLFYDTDNTPTKGKLYANNTYKWSDNPKLFLKWSNNKHGFIKHLKNGFFTVINNVDFLRAGIDHIGVLNDDTTAVNGLSAMLPVQGTGDDKNVFKIEVLKLDDKGYAIKLEGDDETAPKHRTAYFGIYGDEIGKHEDSFNQPK